MYPGPISAVEQAQINKTPAKLCFAGESFRFNLQDNGLVLVSCNANLNLFPITGIEEHNGLPQI